MSEDREKWDAIYSRKTGFPGAPSRVLAENIHLLPVAGAALEIACGLAGNAVLLAERGLDTRAWDISPVAIEQVNRYARERGLPLTGEACDVMERPPAPASCDVIVVAHFLDRALIPHLVGALRRGGLLFYQTFTRTRVTDAGPGNPEFRLADNELLGLFSPLRLLVYREEGRVGALDRGLRDEALIVAQKT
ncbi:MAG: class I SAM-dependent methyltransferase [Gammaproteobacteria bacterium]|nr:class I SAM-dependent methyltransferase [Gammaproteobacteria bacterium]